MNPRYRNKQSSVWVLSHGPWLNSSVYVWDWRPHKHHTSISGCWFFVPRHRPSRQKAYQCKTKCISLRRKDIENETGESTKPDGILCEAFQISADMQSINIQLGCVLCSASIYLSASDSKPLQHAAPRHCLWVAGQTERVCAQTQKHTLTHAHKVKLTRQYVFRRPIFLFPYVQPPRLATLHGSLQYPGNCTYISTPQL